jgi:DNA mismatch repair protein MSH4
MMIDLSTIHSLEIIQNLHNVKSKDCLFGVMNETLTPMGSRLLRSSILQPSTQEDVLTQRYDALEELTNKEDAFSQIRQGEWCAALS